MTLFSGQFTTPVEKAVEQFDRTRAEGLVPPLSSDIDNVRPEILPHVAYGHGVEGNIFFLPLHVRLDIIHNAWYFRRYVGSSAALTRAAEVLEIVLTHAISDDQGGGRVIDINISPPSYAIGDVNWATYVREFIACLIPWYIRLGSITISVQFLSTIYTAAAFREYALDVNRGGMAVNS